MNARNGLNASESRAAYLAVCAGLAIASAPALAQNAKDTSPKPGTSLTIYSSAEPGAVSPDLYRPIPGQQPGYRGVGHIPGYATIREVRPINIDASGAVRFTDVAAYIDPTTVSFTSLTDATASVLEQNYQFDLVSPDKLLEKYIDKKIVVTTVRGDKTEAISGTLLASTWGNLVLDVAGEVRMVNGYAGISFPSLPEGLLTRPTLLWRVKSANPGEQIARVSYETQGITWWADYNIVFTEGKNANSGVLDVGAWVSILNQSGATYSDAQLKLIAGTVNRAPQQRNVYPASRGSGGIMMDMAEVDTGFAEKSFFEYHMYTLGRPATIPENSTKQLELFPTARNVPCEKILMYDGLGGTWWGDGVHTDSNLGVQSKKDVDIFLRFVNNKDANMGMPLPQGRIRVSKLDTADGTLEFIGEDVIRHTPKDEAVLVKLGKAFDVVGERRQVDFEIDEGRRTMTEQVEVKVRNRKDEPVTVVVQEHFYRWTNWTITKESQPHTKLDSRTVHYPVKLEAGKEGIVTYTVRYSW